MVGMTVTVIKTKSREEMSKKRSGKKKCAEGPNCRYKHEYQHDLEFSHELDKESDKKTKKTPFDGPARSTFSGLGQRLGASVEPANIGSNSSKAKKALKNNMKSAASTRATISISSSIPNHGAGGCGRDGSGVFRNTSKNSSNISNSAPSVAICPIIDTNPSHQEKYSVNEDDQYFRNIYESSANGPIDRSKNRIFDTTATSIRDSDIHVVLNPTNVHNDNSGITGSTKVLARPNGHHGQNCLQDDNDKYSDRNILFDEVQEKNFDWDSDKNKNCGNKNGNRRYEYNSSNDRIAPKAPCYNNVIINLDSDEDDEIEFVGSNSNTNDNISANHERNKMKLVEMSDNAHDTYRSSYSSGSNSRYSSTMESNTSFDHQFDSGSRCLEDNRASSTFFPAHSDTRIGCPLPIPSAVSSSSSSSITGNKRSYHHNDNEFNIIYDRLGIVKNGMIDNKSRCKHVTNENKKVSFPILKNIRESEKSVPHGDIITEKSNCSYTERNQSSFYDTLNNSRNILGLHNQNGKSAMPVYDEFDIYGSEFNGYSDDNSMSKPMEIDESENNRNQHINIKCEICGIKVSLHGLDYHLRKHEKNGDLLKHKQNLEYDKSVEEEILKRTIEEEVARVARKKEEKMKEDVLLSEVSRISLKASQLAELKCYQRNLLPEPDITDSTEPSLRIRFSFPVPADQGKAPDRILRRFRTANSFQDAIHFLKAQEILMGKNWILRLSVGGEEFLSSEKRTFYSLGIVCDTSLLVVLVDDEIETESEVVTVVD